MWTDEQRKKHKQTNEQRNEYNHKYKAEALRLIGDKCAICGTTKQIIFHEIHGKFHTNYDPSYYAKRYKDFITLCRHHHLMIHFLSELSDIEAIKALRIVELLRL